MNFVFAFIKIRLNFVHYFLFLLSVHVFFMVHFRHGIEDFRKEAVPRGEKERGKARDDRFYGHCRFALVHRA